MKPRYALLVTIGDGLSVLGVPPDAFLGTPYSYALRVSGGTAPYTFELLSSVTDGWGLDVVTGTLHNDGPTIAGDVAFEVYLRDAEFDFELVVTVSVHVVPLPLSLSGDAGDGVTGTAYSDAYTASGGVVPYTYSIIAGALPDGVTLDAYTGALSGMPTVAAAFSWTVRVTDSLGSTADLADVCTIAAPPVYFLDDYVASGNILPQYGLRRMIRAYTGPCVRVRNASNAELDIGWDGATIHVTDLLAHCGTGDGWVVTTYDHSGAGKHVTRSTTTKQFKIVSAGVYLGVMLSDGVDDTLEVSTFAGVGDSKITAFLAAQCYTVGTGAVYTVLQVGPTGVVGRNGFDFSWYPAQSRWYLNSCTGQTYTHEMWGVAQGFDPTGSVHVMTLYGDRNGGGTGGINKHRIYIDGSGDLAGVMLDNNSSGGSYSGSTITLGGDTTLNRYCKVGFVVVSLCSGDQTGVRSDIEALFA